MRPVATNPATRYLIPFFIFPLYPFPLPVFLPLDTAPMRYCLSYFCYFVKLSVRSRSQPVEAIVTRLQLDENVRAERNRGRALVGVTRTSVLPASAQRL